MFGTAIEADALTSGRSSCTLNWTAPGDDSLTGTALAYDLRYSTDSALLSSNFEEATSDFGLPAPKPAGNSEIWTVDSLLSETTYFFAIKTVDHAGNWSAISNIVKTLTDDQFPPAAISDLQAGPGSEAGDLDISWSAVGDDSLSGSANSYIIKISDSVIDELNWSQATMVVDVPTPQEPGTLESLTIPGLDPGEQYYVTIKTEDNYGNVSPLSNVTRGEARVIMILDVDDVESEIPLDFSLSQNYPNPFNPTTTIEYAVPTGSHVRLTVYNIQRQTVATLVDGTKPPGQYSLIWEGTGSNGSQVASGVYFYRLDMDHYAQARKMVLLK